MVELIEDLLLLEETRAIFCMATMILSSGSTPRSSGTRMLIFDNGDIRGTIGGGKLEAEVIKAGQKVISSRYSRILDFEFSGTDAASLDMICGGNAKIFLEPITPDSTSLWKALHAIKAEKTDPGKPGWLASEIHPDGQAVHRYVSELANFLSQAGLGSSQVEFSKPSLIVKTDTLYFIDPLISSTRVFIFGAGHVSQSLAVLTSLVGFYTTIIDDREEFANRGRFPGSNQVFVLDPITMIFEQVLLNQKDMIVIVTRGHLQDQPVLEGALRSEAGYIGMIGSKRKRELLFNSLREKGFSEDQIARVHSPIGINIGAETPEEIAVSITAELIQQRGILNGG